MSPFNLLMISLLVTHQWLVNISQQNTNSANWDNFSN